MRIPNANYKLSSPETANLLGVSASWLNKSRLAGNGPRFLKLGRRVLYDVADIEDWLSSHKFNNTSGYSSN